MSVGLAMKPSPSNPPGLIRSTPLRQPLPQQREIVWAAPLRRPEASTVGRCDETAASCLLHASRNFSSILPPGRALLQEGCHRPLAHRLGPSPSNSRETVIRHGAIWTVSSNGNQRPVIRASNYSQAPAGLATYAYRHPLPLIQSREEFSAPSRHEGNLFPPPPVAQTPSVSVYANPSVQATVSPSSIYPEVRARQGGRKQASHAEPMWTNELCQLRFKQLDLVRSENDVLRLELTKLTQLLEHKSQRVESLQKSLDLVGDVLMMWLQSLKGSESKRIVTALMDVLSRHEGICRCTHNDDQSASASNQSRCADCTQRTREDSGYLKNRLKQAFGEPYLDDDDDLESLPLDDASVVTDVALPPAFESRSPTSGRQRVPKLMLSTVGSGTWMAGKHTSGDTYMG